MTQFIMSIALIIFRLKYTISRTKKNINDNDNFEKILRKVIIINY